MDDEAQKISEMVRKGTYFTEARAWFEAVYIGPISERTFFLIIAVLSSLIALCGIHAMTSLLPLTDKPALLLATDRDIYDTSPRLVPLKQNGRSLTGSLMRFYITQYVEAHEGYSAATYVSNAAFIHAQSNDATYASFSAGYTATNPASFAAQLGAAGERYATIDSIDIDSTKDGYSAVVHFSVDTLTPPSETNPNPSDDKSRWTAHMQYTYTDFKSTLVLNPETKKKELQYQDPQFQVVSYALTQDK